MPILTSNAPSHPQNRYSLHRTKWWIYLHRSIWRNTNTNRLGIKTPKSVEFPRKNLIKLDAYPAYLFFLEIFSFSMVSDQSVNSHCDWKSLGIDHWNETHQLFDFQSRTQFKTFFIRFLVGIFWIIIQNCIALLPASRNRMTTMTLADVHSLRQWLVCDFLHMMDPTANKSGPSMVKLCLEFKIVKINQRANFFSISVSTKSHR